MGSLTHRAVAAEAGVSHALVTYHFSTATDLGRAVRLHASSRLIEALALLIGGPVEQADVPRIAADLAVRMTTDLREETLTVYELMSAACREPDLQPSEDALIEHIADLIEPLAGDRVLAATAASALRRSPTCACT